MKNKTYESIPINTRPSLRGFLHDDDALNLKEVVLYVQ